MPTTILLVDDSKVIREIIKIYLMNAGYQFLDAEDGERALRIARLMPVDLVIADVRMPGMDGLTFTRKLREETRTALQKLPVILLTGESDAALQEEGTRAGANAFLKKPVTGETLKSMIEQHLPRSAP